MAVGVQAAYNAVARAYHDQLGDELSGKPLDRGLLAAFAELAGAGTIADVGCGPGHVTRFLAARNMHVIGIDISPGMIGVARRHAPVLAFAVGSMLHLPAADGAWSGIIALYSIIHLTAGQRAQACREFARTLRPRGWLLAAFHIDSPGFAAGDVNHLTTWFGKAVELDGHFLEPSDVVADVESYGSLGDLITSMRIPGRGRLSATASGRSAASVVPGLRRVVPRVVILPWRGQHGGRGTSLRPPSRWSLRHPAD